MTDKEFDDCLDAGLAACDAIIASLKPSASVCTPPAPKPEAVRVPPTASALGERTSFEVVDKSALHEAARLFRAAGYLVAGRAIEVRARKMERRA